MCGFCAKSNTAVNCLVSDNSKKSIPFPTIVHSILYVVLDFTLLKFLSDSISKFKSIYENTRVSFREILFPNDMSSSNSSTHNLFFSIRKSVTFFI